MEILGFSSIVLILFISKSFCAEIERSVLVHLYKVFPYAYRNVDRGEVVGIEFELIKLIESRIDQKFEVKFIETTKNRRFIDDG